MTVPNSAPPLIELRDVGRTYPRALGTGSKAVPIPALSGMSLRIHAGEFVCVVGPSGSGKSTLMNIVGCLDQPTEGEYRYCGKNVESLPPDELAALRSECFGFVFQSYNLLGTATASENVELPATYWGAGRAQRKDRAEMLLNAFGVGGRLNHYPRALSGGEQQRVAMARALMNGSRVILADEPTGALDAKNRDQVLGLLAHLATRGHTVIIVTHDPDVAGCAGRRIELVHGRLVGDTAAEPGGESVRRTDIGRNYEPFPTRLGTPARRALDLASALDSVRSALCSLRVNLLRTSRLRTIMTVSSVAVGVWSVVTMLGVAVGGYRDSVDAVSQAGADRFYVHSGRALGSEAKPSQLTLDDVEPIRQAVENVRGVLPQLGRRLTLRNGARQMETVVHAVGTDAMSVHGWSLAGGTFFRERDSDRLEPVAVIGAGVHRQLFPEDSDPVGEYLLIGGRPFLVKGLLSGVPIEGSTVDTQRNSQVLVPMKTGQSMLFGTDALDMIIVHVNDTQRLGETVHAVNDVLARRHGRLGFATQSYNVMRIGLDTVDRLLSGLVGVVGAISLFVGGVGVTSVMLVSVDERRREIGIRMAVGARQRHILRQFLLEAVTITVVGGACGALLGVSSIFVLSALDVPTEPSAWFVLAALGCAVGTGLLAGIVPASKAAGLSPAAALMR